MNSGQNQAAALPLAIVLAAAGAGGGGICAWITLAAQAASHLQVQRAAVAAANAAGDVVLANSEFMVHSGKLCISYWSTGVCVITIFFTDCVAWICLLGGCVVAGGGGWWLARSRRASIISSPRMDSHLLSSLAKFISGGSEPAVQQAALQHQR